MGPDFDAFFHHANRRVWRELFEADGRSQTGWTGPHDHHIEFHLLARTLGHVPSWLSALL